MKKLFSKSLCLKEKEKEREEYIAELEDIIAKASVLYSRKDEMDDITSNAMRKANSREQLKEYGDMLTAMQDFFSEYEQLINTYQRQTAGNAGSGTDEIKFSTLANHIRDARNLQAHHISLLIERMNKFLGDERLETLKEKFAFIDMILKMSSCSIEQKTIPKKHYLFAFKANDIELELGDHTILVHQSCVESSRLERVINMVEQNLDELSEGPEYPNALVLFLQRNSGLSSIGSSFFDRMPQLCFLDLSDTRIRMLPSSIFRLSKLKVLLLRNCAGLEDLPAEVEKLKKLQVLDLSGTPQDYVPVQMGKLNRLRHLQLSIYGAGWEIRHPRLPPGPMIPRGILSEFKELEALSITVHPEDYRWPKNAEECIIKDLVTLERLVFLQFHFPMERDFLSFIRTSPSWCSGRLRKFKFIIGRNNYRMHNIVPRKLESLFDECNRCLRVMCGYQNQIHEEIKNVLLHTTAFYLDSHMEIQSFSEYGNLNFRMLKFCLLRECPKLGVVFENKENDRRSVFECLEYLGLYGLCKLEHIWKTRMTYCGSFKALKHLTVSYCTELRYILTESMIECLANLEELFVTSCYYVETIVKEDAKKKITKNKNDRVLPRLRIVVLEILPSLVSLGKGLCPTKQRISIMACEKLILNSSHQQLKK